MRQAVGVHGVDNHIGPACADKRFESLAQLGHSRAAFDGFLVPESQGRGHADGKPVTVTADIEHMLARWQSGSKLPDVRQKMRRGNGLVRAVGDDVVSMRMGDERKGDHGWLRGCAEPSVEAFR